MKAIVYDRYGPPANLRLEEVEKPVPVDDQVLVKIHAVSLNRSDWETLIGTPLYARAGGLFRPGRRTLGSDIAGRVEAVGSNQTQFRPGDEVFADILDTMGGFAEYVCTRGKVMALKPAGLTFEQAAAIPQAGVIAWQGIVSKGQVRPGQQVLINGAGGSTGVFAVQLAKLHGAEVTGVDNGGKQDFMRSLGADHVIDYTREDFTATGRQYDLILDLVAHRSVFAYRRALRPNGRYFFVGGSMASLFQALLLGPLAGRSGDKRIGMLAVQPNRDDLLQVAELCAAGTLVPAIETRVSLDAVPDALEDLGAGRVNGKLVITLNDKDA
ncbi:MAG: NAD(P)-dependent alcohol dehydrogenase [Caldilineales bacterium]